MDIRDRIKELRRVPARDLEPHPKNWRVHSDGQTNALRGILAEVGYVDALLVRENGNGRLQLIDGHLRAETTPDMEVPVLVLDVTEEEADKILATFDPLGAMADADTEKLQSLLAEIETDSDALQEMLDELAVESGIEVEEPEIVDPEPQIDRAAELQEQWGTKKGDLWEITGPSGMVHRLLCGDSTDAGDVERVMGGERAGLISTDPPYNIAGNYDCYAKDIRKSMQSLKEAEWDRAFDIDAYLGAIESAMAEDISVYVFTAKPLLSKIWAWMDQWSAKSGYCVWCKTNPTPALSKRTWCWGTELVPFATRGKYVFNYPENGHALNWWNILTQQHDRFHVTQKPVAVMSRLITICSAAGSLVFDGCLGSGTTLVAAENLGRRCFGIEISESYTAVCLQRMTDLGCTAEVK